MKTLIVLLLELLREAFDADLEKGLYLVPSAQSGCIIWDVSKVRAAS